MISVQLASQIVNENLIIRKSLLASNILADRDYPPFNRVMMDGIAIKFSAFEKGIRTFQIVGVQGAGMAALKLLTETDCLEVMTGAPLPEGAELVIPYEHLEIKNKNASISNDAVRKKFENVHLKGSDCKIGDVVLPMGSILNGPHKGIAASVGQDYAFSKSSRIQIISTGDELVEVFETPLEHQIRRSNAHALKKSLELNGYTDVSLSHLKDDPHSIVEHYTTASIEFDVLIYSGGVSKGKFDYLPNVWADLGVKKLFHEVAQRPGKPLWFGHDEKNKTHIVGLPGNPVSSLVCLHRYFIQSRKFKVKLSEEITFNRPLTYFLPVTVECRDDGSLWARPLNIKNSGEFTALAGSDGFIELPAEKSIFSAGELFSFFSWSGLC